MGLLYRGNYQDGVYRLLTILRHLRNHASYGLHLTMTRVATGRSIRCFVTLRVDLYNFGYGGLVLDLVGEGGLLGLSLPCHVLTRNVSILLLALNMRLRRISYGLLCHASSAVLHPNPFLATGLIRL